MKQGLFIVIFNLFYSNLISQNLDKDEIVFINSILPDLIKIDQKDTLYIFRDPLTLNRNEVFTKEHFRELIYPNPAAPGISKKNVNCLIKKLDFEYIRNYNSSNNSWNDKDFEYRTKIIPKENADLMDKIKKYSISRPIFTKDKKIAFIAYTRFSGTISEDGFGYPMIVCYKAKGKKWKFFTVLY